jgi:hypothetical protein
MKRGQMIYVHSSKWWQRPLACLLGFHSTRPHPGGISWEVCRVCDGERAVA